MSLLFQENIYSIFSFAHLILLSLFPAVFCSPSHEEERQNQWNQSWERKTIFSWLFLSGEQRHFLTMKIQKYFFGQCKTSQQYPRNNPSFFYNVILQTKIATISDTATQSPCLVNPLVSFDFFEVEGGQIGYRGACSTQEMNLWWSGKEI